jgi:hypothetical protein
MYRPKVFLSGGFKSAWQERIILELSDRFTFFNPQGHGLDDHNEYAIWDIHFVKECDILFGYMERTNPSGYGLALELGIAYALNKTIILVDERSADDLNFARYYHIVHKSSGVVFSTLDEGVRYLGKFCV